MSNNTQISPNNTQINQFKLGKLNVDNSKLSNEDKIRLVRLENLTKSLIIYYERSRKLAVEFDEGHSIENTTNQ